MIISKTPLRISFAGGGTDFPSFYKYNEFGAVLSASINSYLYVTVKDQSPLFGGEYRLNYSETELVQNVCDIDNKIVRGCLQSSNIQESLYVNVVSDVPAGSGLGSSSGFCVGLLRALYAFKGEKRAAQELADEAAQIEINLLSSPIGLQDHYASAVGGINVFRFLKKEVTVLSRTAQFREIERYLMMFWTGICREANDILETQVEMVKARRTFDYLILALKNG